MNFKIDPGEEPYWWTGVAVATLIVAMLFFAIGMLVFYKYDLLLH